MWEYIKDKGILLAEAAILLAICIGAYFLIMYLTRKILGKTKIVSITQKFLLSLLKVVLFGLIIIIMLNKLNVETTGLLALVAAAGLAVSLALQNSLSNLANGIVVVTTQPFLEGDYVSIGGVEGSVKEIRLLTTHLITVDGKYVILPNSSVVTQEVVNYSANGKRRVDFNFSVAYDSDTAKVKDIITKVIKSSEKVHNTPAALVVLKTLGASSIDFFANCWCDSGDYWDVLFYVTDTVFNEFKKEGISVPYNQLEVRMRNDDVVMPFDDRALAEKNKTPKEVEETSELGKVLKRIKKD
ncbi:MAG: mechanosensitive ion channel [Clostridia bacterium]|nr:mechanosensitive ion channel [Clostridia bacterium]